MEVHSHTHTERKKFTHYLWEFLMLFLAVFCGFLAENFREHQLEREREKQFIQSMVADLGEDTLSFKPIKSSLDLYLQRMDTLLHLLSSPDAKTHGADLYYLGRMATRIKVLAIHDGTMQQLKNSGSFRLIRNEKVAAEIIAYYDRFVNLNGLQEVETTKMTEYTKMAIHIFHPAVLDSMGFPGQPTIRPQGNPPLMTYAPTSLLPLASMVHYMMTTRFGIIQNGLAMDTDAKNLILLLKKEYHLK